MFPSYFDAKEQRDRIAKLVRGQQIVVTGVMGVGYLARCEVIWEAKKLPQTDPLEPGPPHKVLAP
jgi:hypothetical protein